MRKTGCHEYNPIYGVNTCNYSLTARSIVCSSVTAANIILAQSPNNILEEIYASLLAITELEPICLKPTGSLLLGSTHEGSDLDLVIDEYECVLQALEKLENMVTPLNLDKLIDWAIREARARRLPIEYILKLYRPWQRFVYATREVSISIASSTMRMRDEKRLFHTGRRIVKVNVFIEPLQPSALDYPSVVQARSNSGESYQIVVFDGIYTLSILEGGPFLVRGVEGKTIRQDNDYDDAIFVGVSEEITFLLPRNS